jgi:hypothetical protein
MLVLQPTVLKTRSSSVLPACSPSSLSELPCGMPLWCSVGSEAVRLRGATDLRVLPEPSWVRCAR